jgi:hypothetical protein
MEASSRALRQGTRKPRLQIGLIACLALAAFLMSVAPAEATPHEERQGSLLLGELESRQLKCSEASAADFELVGEYAMGRAFASPAQHEAMNQMMARMMGSRGEEAVHEAMGRRFSGCGGGHLPLGFGQMMGAVNAMGVMGGDMMGGNLPGRSALGAPGSMMGDYAFNGNDEGSDGPTAGAMVGMMAVLVGAAALALLLLIRWRPGDPLKTLGRRYATGELSAEEYEERRRLLEGSRQR